MTNLTVSDLVKLLQTPGYKLVITHDINWIEKTYKVKRISTFDTTPNRISAIIYADDLEVHIYPSTVIQHYVLSNSITLCDKDRLYKLQVRLEYEEKTIQQLLES